MKIFVPEEARPRETRAAVLPDTAEKLIKLGALVEVESGLGKHIGVTDDDFRGIGATVSNDRTRSFATADMVLRLNKPPAEEIDALKEGCIHISFLDPFNEPDLIDRLSAARVTAISMELIPRTTIAQAMDALSSQASLAGYAAAVIAADRLDRVFPMMMTPAGTISPARVFVVGVGVAGLQAIATAKRLGAVVMAFDTRAEVEEQVRSLGGRFVKIDLGDSGQTKDGYAKSMSEEQLEKQRREMLKQCKNADVVIAAAQVFGKKAPRIISSEMIEAMRPGSVIVDCAVENGGNVEGSEQDKEVELCGVRIVGLVNLPGEVPSNASQMYSNNIGNLVAHSWDADLGMFKVDLEDDIIKACVVTHEGEIISPALLKRG